MSVCVDPAGADPFWCRDAARLELAMRHAYHAADATPITADALGQIPPDALMTTHLTLAPAVTVISSDYPIHGIYVANTVADAPAATMRPETVVITRPAFDPIQHLISPETAAFIKALSDGQTMGDATNHAGKGLDLGATLGLLLGQNAITSLT